MRRSDQESYVRNKERAAELERRKSCIRQLNDQLRQTFSGGRIMVTCGVQELGSETLQSVLQAVARHDDFEQANDPHEEHDFGALTLGAHRFFWKIDYYDKQLEYGSPDPADPAVTARVLTIMLASEY